MARRILIIGGGVAGLAAARSLSGFADVIVLEARNRLGGRVWTTTLEGERVDLGASWVHGVTGNPVARLARKWGLTMFETDWDRMGFLGGGSRHALRARERVASLYRRSGEGSVARIIPRRWLASRWMGWALKSEIEVEYGEGADGLSLEHWRDDREYAGGDWRLEHGYGEFVSHLAEDVRVLRGHVVRRIAHSRGRVEVVTSRGRFAGDAAIVTLPLGVLKAGSVIFDPPLSARKQEAIAGLGVGVLNKLALVYRTPFWRKSTSVLGHFGPYPIFIAHGRTLVGLVGGAAARRPAASPPVEWGRPLVKVGTRWDLDPFALGAYSIVPPGGTSAYFDRLAEPDGPLHFAGEATSRHWRGTVHGALLSGRRAAREIGIYFSSTRTTRKP